MSAALKYFLARLGLFLAIYLLLLPLPWVKDVFVRLMIALVLSFALSYFVLRKLRDAVAVELEGRLERRKEEKEKLRKALSGEDQTPKE